MIKYVKESALIHSVTEALVTAYAEGVQSKALLTALGDYWTDYYTDSDTLATTATGAVALYSTEYSKLLDMVLASNILDVPPERPAYFQLYSLTQSFFQEHTSPNGVVDYLYTDFPGVESIQYFVSSLFEPGVILERGKHFTIEDGRLKFYVDVFRDSDITNYIYTEQAVPDLRVYLWASNVVFSDYLVYERFGTYVYRNNKNSDEYKNIVLAMMKFFADGKSISNIETVINVMFGLPFSRYNGEVVNAIHTVASDLSPAAEDKDPSFYEIVTSHTTYYAYIGSKLLVKVGDTLTNHALLARCHLVKDYVTDPDWHKNVAFPKELLVSNSGAVSLSELMDKVLKYNIVYVKFVATFHNYEQFKDSVLELMGLIKSGIPVYLHACFERAFAADFSEVIQVSDESHLGHTSLINGVPVTSAGASMEQDEYFSRCNCGEHTGVCEYWGEPILDHGMSAITFVAPSKRQYRGDPVHFKGMAYYGGTNDHTGTAPKDVHYTLKPQKPPVFDGKTSYDHYSSKPQWHKPMPTLDLQYSSEADYSLPGGAPSSTQLFGRHHTCETDYVTGQTIRVSFVDDPFDSDYAEDLTVLEIRNGQRSDCFITGPVELAAGQIGRFTATACMADTIMFSGTMELVSQDDDGFLCRLPEGQNEATLSIYFDDILCNTITITRASTYFDKPLATGPSEFVPVAAGDPGVTLFAADPVARVASGEIVPESVTKTAWELSTFSDGSWAPVVTSGDVEGAELSYLVPTEALALGERHAWRTKVYSDWAGWSDYSDYEEFTPRPVMGAVSSAKELFYAWGPITTARSGVAFDGVYSAVAKENTVLGLGGVTANLLKLSKDGDTLWERRLGNASGADYLPAFVEVGESVYIGCSVGISEAYLEVRAYTPQGDLVWIQNLDCDGLDSQKAKAALAGGYLYITMPGTSSAQVVRLDISTGASVAAIEIPELAGLEVAITAGGGDLVYLLGTSGAETSICVALDGSFEVAWASEYVFTDGTAKGISSAYFGALLYGQGPLGAFYAFISSEDGTVAGTPMAVTSQLGTTAQAVVVGDFVVFSDGVSLALVHRETGLGRVMTVEALAGVTLAQLSSLASLGTDGACAWLGVEMAVPNRKVTHLVLDYPTLQALDGRNIGLEAFGFSSFTQPAQTMALGASTASVALQPVPVAGSLLVTDPPAVLPGDEIPSSEDVASGMATLYLGGRIAEAPYNSVLDWSHETPSLDRSENCAVLPSGPSFPPKLRFGLYNVEGFKWFVDLSTGYALPTLAGREFTLMFTTTMPDARTFEDSTTYSLFGDILKVRRIGDAGEFLMTNGVNIASLAYSWAPGEEVCLVCQCTDGQMRLGIVTRA